MSEESQQRRTRHAETVSMEIARGARILLAGDYETIIVRGRPVNHILHFIVGLFTFGIWWVAWLIMAATGGEKRYVIRTDEQGRTTETWTS